MPRYKPTDTSQTVMVPVRLADQLVPGTFEDALNQIVDKQVDLSDLGERWFSNDLRGAPAFDPRCLLKVVLLGYSKGLYSSRRIARACREKVLFMAISAEARPHFTTIALFVRRLQEEILGIFCKILLICSELRLVGGELFAVDGCKIRGNASKEWSGTFAELEKKREKIRQRVKLMLESHRRQDLREAHGRGRGEGKSLRERVERQRRSIRRISEFLATHQPKPGKDRRERQSNVTDNESAKLHSAHGVVQGYNGLAVVDAKHQIIVAAEPVASQHEGEHLEEILEQAEGNAAAAGMGTKALRGTTVVMDASYYSEGNVKLCEQRRIDGYLPDPHLRSRDPRFPQRNRRREHRGLFGQERFRFDRGRGVYVCPNGKELRLNTRVARAGRFEGKRYEARKADCQGCPLAGQCLKNGATRRKLYTVERTVERDWLGEMQQKIDSARGRAMYAQRMGIVEPVFGNITAMKRLDRFTLRGRSKVRVQWLLYAMVHNIEKIAHYGPALGPPRPRRRRKTGGSQR